MKKLLSNLFNKRNKSRTISFSLVIFAYVLIEVLMNVTRMSRLFTSLLVPTCAYIVVALALNLVVGISGELSLGHAGFMAIGAFTSVVIVGLFSNVIKNEILLLVIAIIIGGIVSGIFGLIISVPVLKLSGDYLAIVTLAFGQIIKSLLNNIYLGLDDAGLHFSFVTNTIELNGGKMLLSGPMGATDTAKISNFTAGIVLILFALFVIYSLINSKYGRAIMAARDNTIAAKSIGVNISKTKTLAFVVSAILAGMAGSLYALNYSTLQPAKFDFNTSILILVYVVFGGLGNINGTMIATTILYILPELLRGLQDYRMLIYAIVLIVVMELTNSKTVKEFGSNYSEKIFRKARHND
mgnify:CR=1 FL=1